MDINNFSNKEGSKSSSSITKWLWITIFLLLSILTYYSFQSYKKINISIEKIHELTQIIDSFSKKNIESFETKQISPRDDLNNNRSNIFPYKLKNEYFQNITFYAVHSIPTYESEDCKGVPSLYIEEDSAFEVIRTNITIIEAPMLRIDKVLYNNLPFHRGDTISILIDIDEFGYAALYQGKEIAVAFLWENDGKAVSGVDECNIEGTFISETHIFECTYTVIYNGKIVHFKEKIDNETNCSRLAYTYW